MPRTWCAGRARQKEALARARSVRGEALSHVLRRRLRSERGRRHRRHGRPLPRRARRARVLAEPRGRASSPSPASPPTSSTLAGPSETAARRKPGYVRARGILDGVDLFDAAFFGITPAEAEVIDPQQRLFLEACWEALESAGYEPETCRGLHRRLRGNDATTPTSSPTSSAGADAIERVGALQTMMGNEKDYLATRVSYKLDLRGPEPQRPDGVLDLARRGLPGRAEPAHVPVRHGAGRRGLGDASPEARLPLPGGRDHLPRRPLPGLRRRGRGHGVQQRPRRRGPEAAGRRARRPGHDLRRHQGGRPQQRRLVQGQLHRSERRRPGRGRSPWPRPWQGSIPTPSRTSRPTAPAPPSATRSRSPPSPRPSAAAPTARGFCALGSLKTNIGHLDAAAGVAGLIKAALALRTGVIPPSLHFRSPNPKLGLDGEPVLREHGPAPLAAGATPRRAGVSSLGVGGTNAHVVLEEAPVPARRPRPAPEQLLVLSARSLAGARCGHRPARRAPRRPPGGRPRRRRLHAAGGTPALRPPPRRRGREPRGRHRPALDARPQGGRDGAAASRRRRASSFLFPGQGAQHVDMGRASTTPSPASARRWTSAPRFCGPSWAWTCAPCSSRRPGRSARAAAAQLGETRLTQPALFVVEHALARLWRSWGVEPQAMIGHSLGEYVAACLAGVFTRDDALRSRRSPRPPRPSSSRAGRCSRCAPPRRSSTVGCRAGLSVAAINSPAADRGLRHRRTRCSRLRGGPRGAGRRAAVVCPPRTPSTRRCWTRFWSPSRALFDGLTPEAAPGMPWVSSLTGRLDHGPKKPPTRCTGCTRCASPCASSRASGCLLAEPGSVLLEVGPGKRSRAWPASTRGRGASRVVGSLQRRGTRPWTRNPSLLDAPAGSGWRASGIDWSALHGGPRRRVACPPIPSSGSASGWTSSRQRRRPCAPRVFRGAR